MGHSMRFRGWRLSISPQEAAIDHNQSQRDQAYARERVAGEDLAKKSTAEETRFDRDQQRHQEEIGRTGAIQNPKVEKIGERRAHGTQSENTGECRQIGHAGERVCQNERKR